MSNYRNFWEAGYRVFGLHPITKHKTCGCGNPKCTAVGKHPIISNWTSVPYWSEDQLETFEEGGQFDSGYGVLVKGLLVIDVDARNGGVASYERLVNDFPKISAANLIVETGSGSGSKHLYFNLPENIALRGNLPQYPGIDFKSSGFVVGPGSAHISGNKYTILYGSPADIDEAPAELVEALRKEERHRATYEGRTVDVSHTDLGDMLSYINNEDLDYEVWIRIGMSLHHASGGEAYDLWKAWSATSSKHNEADMPKKWHSFGKSANPVTLGTLVYYAQKGGWEWPVTFVPNEALETFEQDDDEIDLSGIDLRRPPGFVGQVAQWIHDQCPYVRETIAMGTALISMGNVVGLKYRDPIRDTTSNLIGFCVAASATGKESILRGGTKVLETVELQRAAYGTIKSEQEIVRNLVEHQASFYMIDEVGFLLKKIKSAQTKGGASYLEAIIGIIMSIYSKASGTLLISGDVKKEIRKAILQEINQIERQLEDGPNPIFEAKRDRLATSLEQINSGIKNPFLSLIGYTTNSNFDDSVDYENATNGFIGRSLLFIETKTVPQEKPDFKPRSMPDAMANTLKQIYMAGSYDVLDLGRIESSADKIEIPTTDDALAMLKKTSAALHNLAEDQAERTGLEALFLRGKELVAKVSFILAVPEGIRTVEHVRWAYALVKNDVETKARVVIGNDRQKDSPEDAIVSRIQNLLGDDGETLGVLLNRLRPHKKENVEKVLDKLVERGFVIVEESVHPRRRTVVKRYKKARK